MQPESIEMKGEKKSEIKYYNFIFVFLDYIRDKFIIYTNNRITNDKFLHILHPIFS